MKLRVVVLGAGGFIGQRLVSVLAASAWAVPVAASHRSPLPAGAVERVQLDAAHEPSLARALEGADAVVNCIAGSAATIVATAQSLFAVVGRAPRLPRVVHMSSMAVYGSASGTVAETAELRSDAGAYGAAKVAAERLAASCSAAVLLRPGCIYGPGSVQWSERIARWLTAHRVGDLGAAGAPCASRARRARPSTWARRRRRPGTSISCPSPARWARCRSAAFRAVG